MSEKTREQEAVEEFTKKLDAAGVEVEKLGVVAIGPEQVMGEILLCSSAVPPEMVLKNPRRFIRLQQVANGNFRVEFLLIDYDLISTGRITVFPDTYYLLKNLDIISQARMLGLYCKYLDDKTVQRAQEAGLVTSAVPNVPVPPNGGPMGGNVRPLR